MILPSPREIPQLFSLMKLLGMKDFIKLSSCYFGITKNTIVKIKNTPLKIYFKSYLTGQNALIENFKDNVYLKYTKIRDNDVILDLGAHIGIFALRASLENPEKIICVEPIKSLTSILKKNITINNLKNKIEVIEKAVYHKNKKTICMIENLEATTHNFLLHTRRRIRKLWHSPVKKFKRVAVETISLKNLIKTFNPTIIKCDIEGEEYETFLKLNDKYLENIRYIALEYHEWSEFYSPSELCEYFHNCGFRVIKEKCIIRGKEVKDIGMIYALGK